MSLWRVLPSTLVLGLAACGAVSPQDEPVVSDYDASCGAVDDCVAVVDRGYCGGCDAWAALSVVGGAAFDDDQDAHSPSCPGNLDPMACPDLAPEDEAVLACEAGVCVVTVDTGLP